MTPPKIWRRPHPKIKDNLSKKMKAILPKNDLIQKMKTTSPKKWRRTNKKMRTTSPKNEDNLTQNEDDLTQKLRWPNQKNKTISLNPSCQEDDLIEKIKTTSAIYPKKQRRPHQKIEDPNPKNEDNLSQKFKTIYPKKWRRPHPKMKTTSSKNDDDLTQKLRRPNQKNKTISLNPSCMTKMTTTKR